MIVAIGTDLVALERIRGSLERTGARFLEKVFTPAERAYCESQNRPVESFAARFAAKEAVMKCLGTGWASGVGFAAVEVTREESGAVGVTLHGKAAEIATDLGIVRVHLSLSHTDEHAVAFAVAVSDPG